MLELKKYPTGISRKRIGPLDWLQVGAFLLLAFGLVWVLITGAENLGYDWHWTRIPRYLLYQGELGWQAGPLLQGLGLTVAITVVSLLLTMVIGLTVALMRLSGSLMGWALAKGYLELIRNTPLLIQIFIIYFVFSPILGLDRFTSAVLALSLFEGAYASEIIRAGILAIPAGQSEASASLGMTTYQNYRYIILPQALRQMMPPLTSQGISLIKDSALVSTIAIYDLTMQGQRIVAQTFLTFEVWFTVAAIYLVMTIGLSGVVKALESTLETQDQEFLSVR
ncbi:MAG TPA: amino acid ABC transporter permease [Desulfuromonadales bacterium]|nr:amino acid ABC transporter permease [Desulfuromonadales bacterium]